MPRNSSGTYTAPVDSWNPAVDGTTIDPTDWNSQLADYVSAFTDSLSRSGDGGMLADLEVDANAVSLTEIASPASPAANNLKVYAVDVTGTTKLAYKDSAGTETILSAAGTGDVVGPGSATDNAVARFDSTTGKLIQNSAVTIADTTGAIAGTQSIAISGSSSGVVTINPQAAAGTYNFNLPTTAGSSGQALLSGGGGAAAHTYGTVLKPGTTDLITVGYTVTPGNLGTVSSGTTTLAGATGQTQYLTNNGAFTLAAPAADTEIDLLVTNGASAGAITFSGFTVGSSTGSALTTTNTSKFLISIRRINSVSTYSIYALQ